MSENKGRGSIPVFIGSCGSIFMGHMPQVPRKGESILFDGRWQKITMVGWRFDSALVAWEAVLTLEQRNVSS